jgi:hypothetical protein
LREGAVGLTQTSFYLFFSWQVSPPPSRAIGCEIDAYEREMYTEIYTSETHCPTEFYHLLKMAKKIVYKKSK